MPSLNYQPPISRSETRYNVLSIYSHPEQPPNRTKVA